MLTRDYRFPAARPAWRRAHVGVVASGDLEVLVDPDGPAGVAVVHLRTSVDGFEAVWAAVLERSFTRTGMGGRWQLNDAGATPGVVALRLGQAAEQAGLA